MRKLLIGLGVLVSLLVLAVILLPTLVPGSVYKDTITERVSEALGRDVMIDGDVKLSVLPSLQARANSVRISNPEGFADTPFASMGELRARVKLLPLLSKRVEIVEFTLVEPNIALTKLADGRTNWTFGDNTDETTKSDAEGFKRDKGFDGVDASFGALTLIGGTITYNDPHAGVSHTVTNANLSIDLPDLKSAVKLKGDLVFDGEPIDITVSVDTPDRFMRGDTTPFTANIKSALGDVNTKGEFLETDTLAFSANIDASIPSLAAIVKLAGQDIPYSDLAESLDLKGDIRFDGETVSGTNSRVDVKGALIDADYLGAFSTAKGADFNGKLNANVKDLPALLKALDQDIPQASLVKTLIAKADISGTPDNLKLSNADVKANGTQLRASYSGTASISKAIALNGAFTADISDVPGVLTQLGQEIDAAKAVQTLAAKGDISGDVEALNLSSLTATLKGKGLSADYSGGVTLGETPTLSGQFTADIASLDALSKAAAIDIAYADIAGGLKANGAVSGPVDTLKISALNAQLLNGLLTGTYENGTATIGETVSLSGELSLKATSVRAIALRTGTELPEGDIFGPFALSGTVSGTPENISFDNATLSFDAIKGDGKFGLNMTGTKPKLTGDMALNGLDLRPYMAKSTTAETSGGIKPWSESELDLSPLKAVDANLQLTTPNVLAGRIALGQSTIKANLVDGKLTAAIPGAQLYSGTGTVTAVLDGSKAIPAVSLDVNLDKLNTPEFFGAAAGFGSVTGDTSTILSLSGSGRTQSELMQNLNGTGDYNLLDGSLLGVNLTELLTGIEEAWSQRTIPSGIGPGKVTEFSRVLGNFKIVNGVATVDKFDLTGNGLTAEAAGTLDIGNQKIDFSLRPRVVGEDGQPKSGLSGFGIPLRLQGSFGSVKAGIDTQLLGQIVAKRAEEKAREEASKAIKDRVGGPLGDILGGVIGGGEQAPADPFQIETPDAETPPELSEEEPQDKVTDDETKEDVKPEDVIEDALKDLFKKKD